MAKLVIDGISPSLDGAYETDFTYFKNREWRTIKELSGVRMGEFNEALEAGDNDLVVALAVIALRRRNIDVNVEALWEAPSWKITLSTEDADALPPDQSGTDEPTVEPESGRSSAPLSVVSGDAGPETTPAATGTQG
jgi:hypothetical protein